MDALNEKQCSTKVTLVTSPRTGFFPKWVRFCGFHKGKDLPQGVTDPAVKKRKGSGFGEITSTHFVGILSKE